MTSKDAFREKSDPAASNLDEKTRGPRAAEERAAERTASLGETTKPNRFKQDSGGLGIGCNN
jgi:hypothetical protein